MSRVKIVVDSSTDIPPNLIQELDIQVVPMPVTIEGTPFLEGVNLNIAEFYPNFKDYKELPKTSQPNLQDLVNHYRAAVKDGSPMLAIHLSSGLSGTYQTALLAKEMVGPEAQIKVIDSLGATLGSGMLAIRAAQLADQNLSLDELANAVEADKQHMRYIFTPDTLEYLIKGGRVSKVSGAVGTLLDIKPLLQVNAEGKLDSFGKVRGRKSALKKLADTLAEEITQPEQQVIGISHAMCLGDAEILAEEIRSRVSVKEIIIGEIGCTIGSHTGPGCIALFYRR